MLRDIKNDTEKIVQHTSDIKEDISAIKDDTDQIRGDVDRILLEISRLQVVSAENSRPSGDYVLNRDLEELKSGAETVLGDDEHLDDFEDSDDEDAGRIAEEDRPSSPVRDGGKGRDQTEHPIIFTILEGRRYPTPYSACQTWVVCLSLGVQAPRCFWWMLIGHRI
jgi:hypothetical protein